MNIKRLTIPLLGAALIGGSVIGLDLTAMAASSSSPIVNARPLKIHGPRSIAEGVTGTVTNVSGSTITITTSDGAVYTIDTSGAAVHKYANGMTSSITVSAIALGDTVTVRGTVKTATLSAKSIRVGSFPRPTPPVAVGKVTAINGSILTLSSRTKSGTAVSYTVDATNAVLTKIVPPTTKGNRPTISTIPLSAISIGDVLRVRGTKDGTSIAAISIIDNKDYRSVHERFGWGTSK